MPDRHNYYTNLARRLKPLMLSALANNPWAAAFILNKIILLPSGTGDPSVYPKTGAGLTSAISASSSGDAIYIPPGTLTASSWTNKSGVTIRGYGDRTVLSGNVTNAGQIMNCKLLGNHTNTGTLADCLLSNEGVGGVVLTQSAGITMHSLIDNYDSGGADAASITGGQLGYVIQSKQNAGADGVLVNGDANTKIYHSRFIGQNFGLQVETAGEVTNCFAVGGTSGALRHTTGTCVVSNSFFLADSSIGGAVGVVLTAGNITIRDCGWSSITGDSFITYGRGDRGSYSVEDFHATDIEAAVLTRHLPQPTSNPADAGKVAKLNGAASAWELSAEAAVTAGSPFPGDPYTYLVSDGGNAAIHVNPNQYRYDAISSVSLSGTVYQAVTFWDENDQLVIGKRVLDGDWTLYVMDGTGGRPDIELPTGANLDNHDVANLGFDPDGYIHVAYAMHSNALLYRKSDAAIDTWTGGMTATLSMVGANETLTTYPTFFNDPSGVLYFMFRQDDGSESDWYFYKYTHGTTTWAAASGTGTGGKLLDGASGTSAYIYRPIFDSDFGSGGFLHIGFQWRTTPVTTGGENTDVSYTYWTGSAFKKADGSAQTVPITNANAEVVDAIDENEGLTNFNSIYSDSDRHPHLTYQKLGDEGYRHIYHAWHNGSAWTIRQLTDTKAPNQTDHDLHVLVPLIVIKRSTDEAFVIYVDHWDTPGILMLRSAPGDFTVWYKSVIYPLPTGWWNPHIDWSMWERSTDLYVLIEYFQIAEGVEAYDTGNPPGGGLVGEADSFPIRLLKWEPSETPWQDYLTPAAGGGCCEVLMADGEATATPLANDEDTDWLYEDE